MGAYRCRVGGRGSNRIASELDAREALERALERIRREQRVVRSLTLRELVDEYLDQHDAEPETIEKLRWLLAKAVKAFADLRLGELRSQEIASWRMTIAPGHRFEATQALAVSAPADRPDAATLRRRAENFAPPRPAPPSPCRCWRLGTRRRNRRASSPARSSRAS